MRVKINKRHQKLLLLQRIDLISEKQRTFRKKFGRYLFTNFFVNFFISQKEIENRPTPQSYDLLAYTYQQKGDYKKALAIAEKHVANKTHEPVAQYHLAEIYKANGLYDRVVPIKKELLEASYELGPITTRAIKNL